MIRLANDPQPYRSLDLPTEVGITVNTFGWAVLRHPQQIVEVENNEPLWVLPLIQKNPGLLVEGGLWLPDLPATPGRPLVLTTRVFNTTAQPIYIKKGTILSRLVFVKLE